MSSTPPTAQDDAAETFEQPTGFGGSRADEYARDWLSEHQRNRHRQFYRQRQLVEMNFRTES